MTFKNIILKNLSNSIQHYLAYFFCIAFSIAFFFILVNLIQNPILTSALGLEKMPAIGMIFPLSVLIIFSLFFINYVNITFFKGICRELGLFLALGMDKKKVSIIVTLQNVTIAVFATTTGLLLGTVFSKLFFMLLLKATKLTNLPYSLYFNSYYYTIICFTAIFFCLLITRLWNVKRLHINELLNDNMKKEITNPRNSFLGFISLIMMISSFILLKKEFLSLNQSIILTLIALYLFISQFGNLLNFIYKKNKPLWYKNLIFNVNIRQNINSNSKFIFVLTMCYFLAFLFWIVSYNEYTMSEATAKKINSYDLVSIDIQDSTQIPQSKLNEIIKTNGSSITKEQSLEFIEMSLENQSAIIICDENYNKVFNDNLKVLKGNIIILNNPSFKNKKQLEVKYILSYKDSSGNPLLGKSYYFNIQDIKPKVSISDHPYLYGEICLVSKEDFDALAKNQTTSTNGMLHFYNLSNWKNGYEIENALNELYGNNNLKVLYPKFYMKSDTIAKVFSTVDSARKLTLRTGLILFFFGFVCLIFFLSSSSLLYFKYFSEIGNEKSIYKKLSGIGITHKQVKSMIGKDMTFTFFFPYLLGALIALIYCYTIYSYYQLKNLFFVSSQILILCFFFQIIFYGLTKRKVILEVLQHIRI